MRCFVLWRFCCWRDFFPDKWLRDLKEMTSPRPTQSLVCFSGDLLAKRCLWLLEYESVLRPHISGARPSTHGQVRGKRKRGILSDGYGSKRKPLKTHSWRRSGLFFLLPIGFFGYIIPLCDPQRAGDHGLKMIRGRWSIFKMRQGSFWLFSRLKTSLFFFEFWFTHRNMMLFLYFFVAIFTVNQINQTPGACILAGLNSP